MKVVPNVEFYAVVSAIKKPDERKPHLKIVKGGVELHYKVGRGKERVTVAIARNVNKKLTYLLPNHE